MLEQLALSERFDSYLPLGSDDVVKIMTEKMSAAPHDLNTLTQWSGMLGLSERTLSRRFLAATGISFNEWKLRSKTLMAMTLLQEGKAVKYVASTLGYNDPSAFIAMFRRQTGQSPPVFSGKSWHSENRLRHNAWRLMQHSHAQTASNAFPLFSMTGCARMTDPDFNLLIALDALLTAGSVAGAARRLGLSASAMSRTSAGCARPPVILCWCAPAVIWC